MSNLSPSNPIQPLSIGNVVSASVRLYRSNAKRYLILVLRLYLWSFVPIYGWAKSVEIAARISRLAYQDLINQPESLTEAYQKTDRQIWNFFGASLLVGLIYSALLMGLIFAYFIVSVVILFLIGMLTGGRTGGSELTGTSFLIGLVGTLLLLALIVIAFLVWLRVFSRLFIFEVPLAIEENSDAANTIGRSWTLTKGSVNRIQLIVLVAGVLTWVLILAPTFLVLGLTMSILSPSGEEPSGIAVLLFYLMLFLGNGLILPFWQAIKAVVYYDLRSRREGLGLELRDRS